MVSRNDVINNPGANGETRQRRTDELNESAEIFQKYDTAERSYGDDEEWEVYRRTDRHGFMHEQDGHGSTTEDDRARKQELKREHKWLKMLQRWPKYERSVKLRRFVYKGIPQKFRAEVWRRLLNIDGQKMLGIYEKLRLGARFYSKDTKQIDLDIHRTYRNHVFYRQRYGYKQRSLLNVLAAYSMFNRELGYCQGMNHLAALLLMYFVEEDAFWALHILMCDNAHAMHGFFMPGFPKLLRFQQHHDAILKKKMPRLRAHLESQGVHAGLYTTKWFFQCFLDRVPFSLALRLWDIFMLEGDVLLTVMAYAILRVHERQLIKLTFEQTMEFLQVKLEKNFGISNDAAIEALQKAMVSLGHRKLLYPPPPSRSELPSEPVGAITLELMNSGICSAADKMSNKLEATADWIDAMPSGTVRGSPCTDELDYYRQTPPAISANGTPVLPDQMLLGQGRTLAHVPSYYDNLQEDFCCSSANCESQGKPTCKHFLTSISSIPSGGVSSFCIEMGSDHVTRIRIDTP